MADKVARTTRRSTWWPSRRQLSMMRRAIAGGEVVANMVSSHEGVMTARSRPCLKRQLCTSGMRRFTIILSAVT